MAHMCSANCALQLKGKSRKKKTAKSFFLLLRFPLGGAADHLVCPESPFEDNKDVWTLVVKIKGAS